MSTHTTPRESTVISKNSSSTKSHMNNQCHIMTCFIDSYQRIKQHLTPRATLWIACSGGRDSMVLAYVAQQLYLSNSVPLPPRLVHVHHGMQKANDDWALMVQEWAQEHAITCDIMHANLTAKDEQSARNARYTTIMSMMNEGDILALGHHAHDQAETMLMRLFQGAGVKGLTAMQEWSTKTHSCKPAHIDESLVHRNREREREKTIQLWRPLLSVSREQISHYAHDRDIRYVDDPTNIEGDNVRSHLRTRLIPPIEACYPQAISAMNRSIELLQDAESIMQEVLIQDLQHCAVQQNVKEHRCEVLDIEKLCSLSRPRLSQLIHAWLQGDEPKPASKLRVDEIINLVYRADNDQQTQLNWQGQNSMYSVRRYKNHLYRMQDTWLKELEAIKDKLANLSRLDEELITDIKLFIQQSLGQEYTTQDLVIRALSKTDKIKVHTKGYARSGKKILQELSIPRWERDTLVIVLLKANTGSETKSGGENTKEQVLLLISPRFSYLLPHTLVVNAVPSEYKENMTIINEGLFTLRSYRS